MNASKRYRIICTVDGGDLHSPDAATPEGFVNRRIAAPAEQGEGPGRRGGEWWLECTVPAAWIRGGRNEIETAIGGDGASYQEPPRLCKVELHVRRGEQTAAQREVEVDQR